MQRGHIYSILIPAVFTSFTLLHADSPPGQLTSWGSIGISYVPPGTKFSAISAATGHNFAFTTSGSLVGWGENYDRQATVPAYASNVVAVAGGNFHTIALKSDGTVVAWGAGSHGKTNVPPGLSNVVQIANGGEHSLALKSDGTVVGWG